MHILIIPSENYVTNREPLASIFQHQQALALRHSGIKTGVISAGLVPFNMTFSQYPYPFFENDEGVNTYRCYKRVLIPGRIAIKVFWKFIIRFYLQMFEKYVVEQGLPDVIHAHNCLFAGIAALKIKEKYSIPYLITEHSSAYARGLISNQQSYFTREVLKNANVITVVSSSLRKSLEKIYGADACPNHTIFNILDDRFEMRKDIPNDTKNTNKRAFLFLSIGSLDSNKNHSDLLKAFASKFKGNVLVRLKIGGDGPLKKQLQAEINDLGIADQVVLTGMLSHDRVLFEMQNCNAFVLPSIFETFGVVLIEALAVGKPVVATKCGGPEDIINPNNGILVPPKEVQALAEAMSNIYSNINKYDASYLRNDCLLRFGKAAFVERLRNLYNTIIQGE